MTESFIYTYKGVMKDGNNTYDIYGTTMNISDIEYKIDELGNEAKRLGIYFDIHVEFYTKDNLVGLIHIRNSQNDRIVRKEYIHREMNNGIDRTNGMDIMDLVQVT